MDLGDQDSIIRTPEVVPMEWPQPAPERETVKETEKEKVPSEWLTYSQIRTTIYLMKN